MEMTDRIWHLMAKALNKEATSPELTELYGLMSQDESLQQQYELLSRIWKERDDNLDTEEHANQVVQKIIYRAETELEDDRAVHTRRLKRRRRRLSLSLGLIVIAFVSVGLYMKKGTAYTLAERNNVQEALVAKKGSRTRSLLADGTTVWLNAGSKLEYQNDFNGKTREVRLEGEAFFDVVKQPNRPFIVHTSGIDIKVLGTSFNVKSYPEDKTVETTLYRGQVKVFRETDSENTAINLRPNQKLILPKQAANEEGRLSDEVRSSGKDLPTTYYIAPIDSTKKESERFETAWLFSRLEFRGDNFEELAHKLERWYNVTITFTNDMVKGLNFNGSFEKETVEQAFMALHAAVPLFSYKINNHEIFIGASR